MKFLCWSPTMALVSLYEKKETRARSFPPCEDIKRCLQTKKRSFTRDRISWHLGLGLPSIQSERNKLSFKPPSPLYLLLQMELTQAQPLSTASCLSWCSSCRSIKLALPLLAVFSSSDCGVCVCVCVWFWFHMSTFQKDLLWAHTMK